MIMQILVGGGRSSLHIVSSGTVCYPWTKSWSRLSACCPLARPNSSLGVSRNPFWTMPQINPTSLQPDLFCSSPTRVELDGASIRKVGMSRKLPLAQTRCLGHQGRVQALPVHPPSFRTIQWHLNTTLPSQDATPCLLILHAPLLGTTKVLFRKSELRLHGVNPTDWEPVTGIFPVLHIDDSYIKAH